MIDYQHSYSSIRQQLGSVRLLAVSKTHSADAISTLFALGQREFGENQVQEALLKIEALQALPIIWHFIGPIQTNKTKAIATHFDWVQTLCREKEARRLNEQRPTARGPLQVCIQINIGEEPQKNGTAPSEMMVLADIIVSQFKNLQLRGLLCIPPETPDLNETKQYFDQMRILYEALQTQYPFCDTLSMGMSHDMMVALEAGSTCVRVGQALFGPRGEQTS